MMELGRVAEAVGLPLRHHLTVRLDGLVLCDAESVTSGLHPADGTRRLLGLIRLWHANRGRRWAAVWVRERSREAGEHLHMALHLPPDLEDEFINSLASWLGEERDAKKRKPSSCLVGRSELKNWDLRRDIRQKPGNPDLLAYLGKSEPNRIRRWGRWRENRLKADRTRNLSGGRIEGSPHRDYRWGFSHGTLGPQALAKQGLAA